MNNSRVELIKPEEFFKEKISNIVASKQLPMSEEVEFYLVNLLCEYIQPNKLITKEGEQNVLDTPVAFILKSAIEAPEDEKIKIYKYLGDCTLYISGYFQDYFNNKSFDVDYFISLGRHAYSNVSLLTRKKNAPDFADLYDNLSAQFPVYSELLASVSDRVFVQENKDLVSAYHRWLISGSQRLMDMLKEHGIDPIDVDHKQQH